MFRAWRKRRTAPAAAAPEPARPELSRQLCVEWLRRAPVIDDDTLAGLDPQPETASIDSFADSVLSSLSQHGVFVHPPDGMRRFKFRSFGVTRSPSGRVELNEVPYLLDIDHRDALEDLGPPDGGSQDVYKGSVFRSGDSVVVVWRRDGYKGF